MKKFIVLTCFLLLIYSCSRSISLQYTPPEIVSGNTGIDLIENSGAGQLIHTAEADDSADASAGLSYSLSGADAAAFSIDSATGAVTLTADPDYESQTSYSFVVEATDNVDGHAEHPLTF